VISTPTVPTTTSKPLLTADFLWLLAVQLTFGFGFSTFFLLPKYLTNKLHAEPSTVGAVSAVAALAITLAIPLVAMGIDRFGKRKLILLGAGLNAVSALLFLWVDHVGWLIYVLRVVQGFGFAVAFNAGITLAADLAPREKLGQAIGLFGVALLVTNAIAPTIAEPLAEKVGWWATFLLAAGVSSVSALLTTKLREPAADESPGRPQAGWRILWRKDLRASCFSSLAIGVALGTAFTFYQPFALLHHATRVRSFFIGYAIAALIVRVFLGHVADKLGRRFVTLSSMAAYVVVIAGMSQLRPWSLLLFGALLGCCHGLLYPALTALAVEHISDRDRGKVISFFNGMFNAGVGLSGLVFGFVANKYGYPILFLAASLLIFVTLPWLQTATRHAPE
jgi:MFS family permease